MFEFEEKIRKRMNKNLIKICISTDHLNVQLYIWGEDYHIWTFHKNIVNKHPFLNNKNFNTSYLGIYICVICILLYNTNMNELYFYLNIYRMIIFIKGTYISRKV